VICVALRVTEHRVDAERQRPIRQLQTARFVHGVSEGRARSHNVAHTRPAHSEGEMALQLLQLRALKLVWACSLTWIARLAGIAVDAKPGVAQRALPLKTGRRERISRR